MSTKKVETKYTIKSTENEDKYILVDNVNKKEYEIHRTVELMKELQNMTARARIKFMQFLKDEGVTKADLITEIKGEDGKIRVDESEYRNQEQQFVNDYATEKAFEVYSKAFKGVSVEKLIVGLDLDVDEAQSLGYKIRLLILNGETDDTPSE